jgi:hypothetical protein
VVLVVVAVDTLVAVVVVAQQMALVVVVVQVILETVHLPMSLIVLDQHQTAGKPATV